MLTRTKKAINFDLNNNLLKQNYPSKNYRKAWYDIKKYFESHDFIHRQYSGYISKNNILMTDVFNLVYELTIQHPWLKTSVMKFDVTIVTNEYNLLPMIKNELI